MSGKKSTEVADLLQQGWAARELTNNRLDDAIRKYAESILKNKKELSGLQAKAGNSETLSSDASGMFGAEGQKKVQEAAALLQKLKSAVVVEKNAQESARELKRFAADLQKYDSEAADIRRAIANKYDYCNREYTQASALKKKYEKLAADRRALETALQREAYTADEVLLEAKKVFSQFEAVNKAVHDMNVMAANRKQAEAIRKQVTEYKQGIDGKWANKFWPQEYSALMQKTEQALRMADAQLIEEAAEIQGKLNTFSSKLIARIAQWEQEKQAALDAERKAALITEEGFVDAVDFSNDGNAAEKIKLFEYIPYYKECDAEQRYNDKCSKANRMMQAENFVKAKKMYEEAGNIASEARDMALELQESMIKKTKLTEAICDVMQNDLHYDVDITDINGHDCSDGLRLVCKAGDEIIDFTRIDYDDQGNPIVDIDHTESYTGNCRTSWKDITKALRENGIPITDVRLTATGASILENRVENTASKRQEQTTSYY